MQLLGYYNKKVKTVSSGSTVENCPCRSLNKGKGEKGVKNERKTQRKKDRNLLQVKHWEIEREETRECQIGVSTHFWVRKCYSVPFLPGPVSVLFS